MKAYKTYKFRLYPNKLQQEIINKTLGCTRVVYNYYLSKKKELYNESKIKMSCFECIKDLKNLYEEKVWLKEIDSMALRCALFDLDDAFNGFFEGKGYPRYKSKNDRKNSYRTNYVENEYKNKIYSNIKIDLINQTITLPKLKEVKIRGYRNKKEIKARIINATVSKENNGKYYVSVLVEEEIEEKEVELKKIIGIDVGIKNIVVTSDGEKYKSEKVINKYEKRIKRYQRMLTKKIKGSNNYKKMKKKISKIYSKINNTRKHIIHKITNSLIKQNDIIVTEKLKIQNMMKNHKVAKSISDVSWNEIIRQLEYKSRWNNKKLYQIDTYYPSSKECSVCGKRNEEVKDLSIREYKCSKCGSNHDRDINASINIMFEGLKIYMKEIAI